MCLCYQEPAPGYIRKLISARRALSPRLLHRLQLLLSSLHFTTACCPGPGFAEEAFFPGVPMPSRPLPFLCCLARIHQEDCSYLFILEVPCPIDCCCSCPPCSCPPRGPQLFLGGVQTTAQERAH